MNQSSGLVRMFFHSPLVWGGLLTGAFYALIFGGPLQYELVDRYFTKHPVEYMETGLFFVALAALLLKAKELHHQRSFLRQSIWSGIPQMVPSPENLQPLSARLEEVSADRQDDYFVRRLRAGLQFVRFHGTAEGLEDELKYLADADATRIHNGFGLFRVILWAIPILGFLGTVIGITMALNSVDLNSIDQTSMMKALNGLGLKFDTTALGLLFSMILMFVYFYMERSSNAFLELLEARVGEEFLGRFSVLAKGPDGQVAAVRQMAETMIQVADRLLRQQVDLWQASMEAAAGRWMTMAKSAGEHLQVGLAGAMKESLQTHAQHLAAAEQAAMQQGRNSWEKVLQTQAQAMQNTSALQETVARQAEVLERTVMAVGDVARLEDALNRNLATLAGAKHFEQTVASMAAAIHLLNAKLTEMPSPTLPVKLDTSRRSSPHAA